VQVLVALYAVVWSAVATLVVGLAIKLTMGWRIAHEDEVEGIDFTEHGESAYDLSGTGGARRAPLLPTASVPVTPAASTDAATSDKEGVTA
jgi:Amt family ammonium transporter